MKWRFNKEWEEKIRKICREEIEKDFMERTNKYLMELSKHIEELEKRREKQ